MEDGENTIEDIRQLVHVVTVQQPKLFQNFSKTATQTDEVPLQESSPRPMYQQPRQFRFGKVEFPRFNSDDFKGWLYHC